MSTSDTEPAAALVDLPIDILEDATLVHIGVTQVAEAKFKIRVFPSRSGDTIAFSTMEEKLGDHCPERPRRVVWVAHGLPDNMTLWIEAKDEATGLLVGDKYSIPGNQRFTVSQRAKGKGMWRYNIIVRMTAAGQAGAKLGEIDPDVDVRPDP